MGANILKGKQYRYSKVRPSHLKGNLNLSTPEDKFIKSVSFQESSFPLTSGRKTRVPRSNHFETWLQRKQPTSAHLISLHSLHLLRTREMVAPRVFPFSDHWSRGTKTLATRLVWQWYDVCRPNLEALSEQVMKETRLVRTMCSVGKQHVTRTD